MSPIPATTEATSSAARGGAIAASAPDGAPGGERCGVPDGTTGSASGGRVVELQAVLGVVRSIVGSGSDIASRDECAQVIEAIGLLEDLKDAASAAQASLAVRVVAREVAVAQTVSDDVDVDAACNSRARARRVARARRSAVGQVALARRESPHCGGVFVGMAEALVHEMPHTFAALQAGVLSEFRARALVRETACLTREDRAAVDEAVCADPGKVLGLGNKRLAALAKREGYARDPHAVVRRSERDTKERCVTLRPAPGAMTYLTALVPLAQGVAMLANLQRTAETARATGDGRGKGQIMADTLVERVTGQHAADAVPVMVNLVVSDATLLGSGHEPGVLDGANLVPAQLARELVARAMGTQDEPSEECDQAHEAKDSSFRSEAADEGYRAHVTEASSTRGGMGDESDQGQTASTLGKIGDRRQEANKIGAWVRRLYADAGGNLVAMDSRSRTFPAGLAALLRVRDQGLCRTPWCDAPIAHLDHITPVADGGATNAPNGQGLCAGCNYTKQAPGWTQRVETGASASTGSAALTGTPASGGSTHTVVTTTPAGHEYTSLAPGAPAPLTPGTKFPNDGAYPNHGAFPEHGAFSGHVAFSGNEIPAFAIIDTQPEPPPEIWLSDAA